MTHDDNLKSVVKKLKIEKLSFFKRHRFLNTWRRKHYIGERSREMYIILCTLFKKYTKWN